jgi:hypothetical protein
MVSRMKEGACSIKGVKKKTLIMKNKLEVLKMPLIIRQNPGLDSASLSEVCCIILSLDNLHKHLPFYNMTHP